jgi:methyl-accepting chemotaxis protein
MKWNVGTKIGTGIGIALVIFFLVGAASYQRTIRLIETSDWLEHSYQVLSVLKEPPSLLQEVELANRSYYLTEQERFLEQSRAAGEKIGLALENLRKLTADNPLQQKRLDVLGPMIKERMDFSEQTAKLFRTNGVKAAVERIKSDNGKAIKEGIKRIIDQIQSEEIALLKQRSEENEVDATVVKWTIVLGTSAAVLFAALAGWAITRNIARPLQQITGVAERITAGDLSVKLTTDTRSDEVGVLIRAFNRMTLSLQEMASAAEQIAAGDLRSVVKPQSADDVLGNAFARMGDDLRAQIRELIEGANVLGAAASEILASTTQLAASASESAAAVSETSVTVEEVRQTAQMASQKAKLVSDGGQKSAQTSLGGRKSAEDLGAGMQRIRLQMEAIAASMMRLSEQSEAIGQIIATVEDLAAQSNLLAVNAAIEAAKAGEHGKGFGVVAQEVKSLAEQSRQATNQVRSILGDIQKATGAAMMATEEGGKAVEAGTLQTEIAGGSIQALALSVNEAAQTATQIAASSQQQLAGMDQLTGAMENIRQTSGQNVASAKQLETAAGNLNQLGQRLKQMVERYKV